MLDYTGIAVVRGADGCFHSFLASLSLSLSLFTMAMLHLQFKLCFVSGMSQFGSCQKEC